MIECIFAKLNSKNCLANTTLSNFININSFLKKDIQYTNNEMLIWDDLWFWGFITQNSQGKDGRKFGWNKAKYWSIFTAAKDEASIKGIQRLAKQFLKKLEA